jgi:hypothetical protein
MKGGNVNRKNICAALLTLLLVFAGNSYSGNVKQSSEGRYILENEYLEIELNAARGGGVQNIRYKPKNISLTGAS